jgi:hypothetical protein
MIAATQRIRYRSLPGKRRGLFRGSSVWLAPDHLLAVWNFRFREEYKRFHLEDIQAIAVAEAPRFHISTRSIVIAAVWLFVYAALHDYRPWSAPALYAIAAGLVAAWIYISAACSCRCRIYTAVSRDDLPSVYRTWTARRFMARVEPLIAAAQGGALEANWAGDSERPAAGPALSPLRSAHEEGGTAVPRRTRSLASDILLAALFADALYNYFTLHTTRSPFFWLMLIFNLAEVAAATVILVQYRRKTLRAGMQRLAVATLCAMGILFYVRPLAVGVMAGVQTAPPKAAVSVDMNALLNNVIFREIDLGVTLGLAIAGVAILVFSKET